MINLKIYETKDSGRADVHHINEIKNGSSNSSARFSAVLTIDGGDCQTIANNVTATEIRNRILALSEGIPFIRISFDGVARYTFDGDEIEVMKINKRLNQSRRDDFIFLCGKFHECGNLDRLGELFYNFFAQFGRNAEQFAYNVLNKKGDDWDKYELLVEYFGENIDKN